MDRIRGRLPLTCMLVAFALAAGPGAARAVAAGVTNPVTGHTYFVSEDYTTWAQAEAWATSLGGHLVTINDSAEDGWMQTHLGLASGYYWIGGRDPIEGTFEWVTGEPFLYQNFMAGEPDDDAGIGWGADYLALSAAGWAWVDTNGDFVGFVNGAIAEVPAAASVGPDAGLVAGFRFEARPSVTRDGTRLCFELGRAATVRCAVFDVGGRQVRELGVEPRSAGRGELVWDGRDDAARKVHPGVYVVLLEADAARASCKVMVTR
jgi:hypothetical protein